MKKTIFSLFIATVALVSCSNNGNKAETSDAQQVENNTTENTIVYDSLKPNGKLAWRASHLGGVEPRWGRVQVKSAKVFVDNSTITNASIAVDMTTISVENFGDNKEMTDKLTGHLLSGDFFNVETYPTATFELTSIEHIEGPFNSKITGNLTIKDSTKNISFVANVSVNDQIIGITSEDFSVDRTDWGLSYNVEGTKGVAADYLIANDIGFTIDVAVLK